MKYFILSLFCLVFISTTAFAANPKIVSAPSYTVLAYDDCPYNRGRGSIDFPCRNGGYTL